MNKIVLAIQIEEQRQYLISHLNKDGYEGQKVVQKSKDTFDCATFVRFIFNTYFKRDVSQNGFGKSLTTKIMSSSVGVNYLIDEKMTVEEKLKFLNSKAKPGDIMLFHRQSLDSSEPSPTNSYPGHLGIYLGNGKYIDARWNRGDVAIVDFLTDSYSPLFVGVKDVMSTIVLSSLTKNNYID